MKEKTFFIVGIGASAGGLDAIQQLFDNIPAETGMAYVIVQHLSPNFNSLMPELLAKHTGMEIFTAKDKQKIVPNCIYLNQKNKNITIKGNQLFLTEKSPRPNLNLPIDIFFHTLGEEHRDKSIGVILSGTGSDGSRGIKTIKEAGGTLFVQDPESAQFDGMPNSSIATSLIDFILSPPKIAEILIRIPNHTISLTEEEEATKSNEVIYFQILDLVHKHSTIDFKQYKKKTLLRRLEKRMNINNFSCLYDYFLLLKSNVQEVLVLKQDFLIGVTSFFRDVEVFELIKTTIIPNLCSYQSNDNGLVRIWVPGCSTGEEAYSIAILLDDHIKENKLHVDFKIFATDIDEEALEIAGNGVYSPNTVSEINREYIEPYFVNDAGNMKVIKRIRERIVFSKHNLLKDPPFIRMDLISCRNLLIYLEARIQAKVLMNFQFALRKEGYLLLGNSESLGHQSKFFDTVNSKWKIYKCVVDSKRFPVQEMPEERVRTINFHNAPTVSQPKFEYKFKHNPENVFYKYMSQQYSPAMVFTDVDFNILFVNGDITTRLSIRGGLFQSNLLQLVSSQVAPIIRSAIRKLDGDGTEVMVTDVVNVIGDQEYCFDLGFRKVKNFEGFGTVYIIHFSEDKQHNSEKTITINNKLGDEVSKQRVSELEDELKDNRLQLQNVVEQLETSNEELQSSNEELMASNEELQSTNEELQSVNEELYTVNAELQEKNRELSYLNNDVNNLLNSTEIGTLFLDVDLRIRKFTPSMQKHFNLQDEDVGRSITSFASNFEESDRKSIIYDSKKTLQTLKGMEAEIYDTNGSCYLRRTSPFITNDKKIDGVVIAFVEITALKRAEEQVIKSEEKFRNLFDNMTEGFAHAKIIVDEKGVPVDWRYITVNSAFESLTGLKAKDVIGKRITKVLPAISEDPTDWIGLYGDTALNGTEHYIEAESTPIGLHFAVHTFQPREGEWAATFWDITERLNAVNKVRQSENLFKSIFLNAGLGIATVSLDEKPMSVNPELEKILGYSVKELSEMTFTMFTHPDDRHKDMEQYGLLLRGKISSYRLEKRYLHKDGRIIWGQLTVSSVCDAKGEMMYAVALVKDITKRKEGVLALTDEFKLLNEEENMYKQMLQFSLIPIIIHDTEMNIIDANEKALEELGYTKDELLSIKIYHLYSSDESDYSNDVLHSIENDQEETIETIFKRKNNTTFYAEVRPCKFIINNRLLIHVYIQNINERKEYETKLIEAKKKAEIANVYKNQFLANMSHEIRTPMNGVVGFADLLDDDEINALTRKRYIDIIKTSSNQLLNLINDIIDVSKIEANELSLEFKECRLNDILKSLETSFNEIKKHKNKDHIVLKCTIPKGYSRMLIKTDPMRVQQVLSNLIGNALKYTEEGTVEFGYFLLPKNEIQFFVKDTGMGIPPEKLDIIFDRFEQLGTGRHIPNEGTGLGCLFQRE
ncbi:virulence sensor protein BvgS precursor [Saccharicrinis fermentans DSM 9555 = JCM 21142]|uniref:Virulence sensor protein BvgS n=1 Tax=Saccharicrinis fermentans DSM 9555 = JCM 21142 TaxID=869213 RepID=W7Y1C7_9BACT|nr:chemotaxis protein CheB [Saccharicrinis fermentans]GAF01762.1 virulence sensor protein BvgS precursor [Saccharicrinis fermentans DSM 9555 = JCM 21142]